jgi:hypothetical protein
VEGKEKTMTSDRIMAAIAFLFFAGFLGVIVVSVAHPMLIVVALIGIGLAAYDFGTQLLRSRSARP